MFDCCEMSDVIARRKLRFLQRYAQSDSIHVVCLVCNEHLVKDLSVSRQVWALYDHWLFDFLSFEVCECVCVFVLLLFLILCYHVWWNKDVYWIIQCLTVLNRKPKGGGENHNYSVRDLCFQASCLADRRRCLTTTSTEKLPSGFHGRRKFRSTSMYRIVNSTRSLYRPWIQSELPGCLTYRSVIPARRLKVEPLKYDELIN